MATSNSKLTQDQKDALKDWKAWAKPRNIKLINNGKTTIAFRGSGNTVKFATSVCSDTEGKYRRKVGEYYALSRFMDSITIVMNAYDFENMVYETFGIDMHMTN